MIKTKDLFAKRLLKFTVPSSRYGSVPYVNLDNAATTPPFAEVMLLADQFMCSYDSVHRGSGYKSNYTSSLFDESRAIIKKFVNAPSDSQVVFTGNTTGAMNLIATLMAQENGYIMYSNLEHSSSRLPFVIQEGLRRTGSRELDAVQTAGLDGVLQYTIDPKTGGVNLEDFTQAFRSKGKIKAVVLTASSNLTGAIPNIKAIARKAHSMGAWLILDACQYLQHHALDMQALGADFVCASGHKFYAPYGEGFLVGPAVFFNQHVPYRIGGGNLPWIDRNGRFVMLHQELTQDAGTPNALGAVAMGKALCILRDLELSEVEKYERSLTSSLLEGIRSLEHLEIFSSSEASSLVTFRHRKIASEEIASMLNEEYGIGVRAGQFCTYEAIRQLCGIDEEEDRRLVDGIIAHSGDFKRPSLVRASVGLCNTQNDVDRLLEALTELNGRN